MHDASLWSGWYLLLLTLPVLLILVLIRDWRDRFTRLR
jgi:ferric iron reductase protein FhuF